MQYIVQPWDAWESINTIASRFNVTEEQMMKANPALYSVPVYPGMFLEIPGHETIKPSPEGYIEYVAQPDDSLYSISHRFKLNYQRVIDQNPQIKNPNVIWPGQVIYLIYLGG